MKGRYPILGSKGGMLPHNKAMKSAIEKHGLGRASSARPLLRRYVPNRGMS